MGVQIKDKKAPPRNSPCPCGSGLKFKWCHGDELKKAVCNRVVNEKMVQLIREEQKKRGLVPKNFKCNDCGHTFDESVDSNILLGRKACPKCRSINFEKIAEGL